MSGRLFLFKNGVLPISQKVFQGSAPSVSSKASRRIIEWRVRHTLRVPIRMCVLVDLRYKKAGFAPKALNSNSAGVRCQTRVEAPASLLPVVAPGISFFTNWIKQLFQKFPPRDQCPRHIFSPLSTFLPCQICRYLARR